MLSAIRFKIVVVCLVLGLGVSTYLTFHHHRMLGGLQENASFCNLGGTFDCDSVNLSAFSEVFGIPVAAIGAVAFLIQLLFCAGLKILTPPEAAHSRRFLFYLSVGDLLFSLYLAFASLFYLKHFCIMCVGLYLLVILKILAVFKKEYLKPRNIFLDFKNLVVPDSQEQKGYGTLILLVTIPLGSLLFNGMVKNSYGQGPEAQREVKRFVYQWSENPVIDFNLNREPDMGAKSNPVVIVEYSDFQCPACKRASRGLHTVLKAYESKIQFYYENFPLDSKCNSKAGDHHPQACLFAKVGICARLQGKFWAAHDFIFENQTELSEAFVKVVVDKIGADGTAFDACLKDPQIQEQLKTQIEKADAGGVPGTPALFVNGKLLPNGALGVVLKTLLETTL